MKNFNKYILKDVNSFSIFWNLGNLLRKRSMHDGLSNIITQIMQIINTAEFIH